MVTTLYLLREREWFSMSLKVSLEKVRGRYINPHAKAIRRSFVDVLLWKMGFYDDAAIVPPIPENFSYPLPKRVLNRGSPIAQWINHSTFLVKVMGLTFLTDPIWSTRCSPFSCIGPKRKHLPPFPLEDLGKVDYVLISHNHYDHLDKTTVKKLHKLYPDIMWVVPVGVSKWFAKLGIENVIELSWWEDVSFRAASDPLIEVTITGVPAQHFSGRKISDFNKSLWSGWVVSAKKDLVEKRFYFVGDTGYNPYDFKAIGKKWGSMDLSLIPIGSYSPRIFMAPVHIDPFDATKIHREVGSVLSLAIHWNTFRLSDEGRLRPPYDLYLAMQEEKLDPLKFLAPAIGYEINW